MVAYSRNVLVAGALLVAIAVAAGCEDRRYVEPSRSTRTTSTGTTEVVPVEPGLDVDVNTPAGRVHVDGETSAGTPRRDVKVDVGAGGVEVDVNGKPLVERIRERRAERNEVNSTTP